MTDYISIHKSVYLIIIEIASSDKITARTSEDLNIN